MRKAIRISGLTAKCDDVIRSCETAGRLNIARRYVELVIRRLLREGSLFVDVSSINLSLRFAELRIETSGLIKARRELTAIKAERLKTNSPSRYRIAKDAYREAFFRRFYG